MERELTPQEEVVRDLEQGIAVFAYKKSDGTKRMAIGTRNPNLIPKYDEAKVGELVEAVGNQLSNMHMIMENPEVLSQDVEPIQMGVEILAGAYREFLPKEKKAREPNPNIINYYDFAAKGWRSFKSDNFVEVLGQTW